MRSQPRSAKGYDIIETKTVVFLRYILFTLFLLVTATFIRNGELFSYIQNKNIKPIGLIYNISNLF